MNDTEIRQYLFKLIHSLTKNKPYYKIKICKTYQNNNVKIKFKVIRKLRTVFKQVHLVKVYNESLIINFLLLYVAFIIFHISERLFFRKLKDIYNDRRNFQ